MGKTGRNRGYWFRSGRGGRSPLTIVNLLDPIGNHIKDPGAREEAEEAYHRNALGREKSRKTNELSIEQACNVYVDPYQKHGSEAT